jgi:hypothetical protein
MRNRFACLGQAMTSNASLAEQVAGQPGFTSPQPRAGPHSIKLFVRLAVHPAICENDANNAFRPSDSPLTEYEKEQIALRKNLERLKAERLARDKAKSKDA